MNAPPKIESNSIIWVFVSGLFFCAALRAQEIPRPKIPPSPVSTRPPQNLMQINSCTTPASTIVASWPGMAYIGTWVPPDPHGAAGPNGIIQTVNRRIEYFNKDGSSVWQPVDLSTFFTGNQGCGVTDPKVVYDVGSSRFFVIVLEVAADTNYYLNLAASRNSDPRMSGSRLIPHLREF